MKEGIRKVIRMASKISVSQKITITVSASTKFKKEVGKLLNVLMKDYEIKGNDFSSTKVFKDIFKSNLYHLIDNYFTLTDLQGIQELVQVPKLFESLDALPKKDRKVIFDLIHRQLKDNIKLNTKLNKINEILNEVKR